MPRTKDLTFFEFNVVVKRDKQEKHLRIIQVTNIGGSQVTQKIIELDELKQKELYTLLSNKYEVGFVSPVDEGISDNG